MTGKPLLKGDVNEIKVDEESFFVLKNKKRFIGIYKKIKDKNIFAKPEFVYN